MLFLVSANNILNIVAFVSYLFIVYYFISNTIKAKSRIQIFVFIVVLGVFLISLYLKKS